MSGGFAPGVPALDEFSVTLWRRMLDRAWRGIDAGSLNYGDPAGEPELRQAIADHLRAARGADCVPGQVFITDRHAEWSLDLCARAGRRRRQDRGSRIPVTAARWRRSRAAQLKVIGIPTDEGGIAPQAADWRCAIARGWSM
jgi:GntR family transcriptional regulator/MocR family aminotransferase